ncbi:MAG TPA: tRNA (adenosine(37)-N6)-dimethylallyltransferase MiaA [Methyloceanibacter sp.]|nr:tRNA (adenosine(37)-N6)-dimethylallyltransferase MiaA [Methyloceanibacter sp.]
MSAAPIRPEANRRPDAILIAGPTASGKSAAALAIAQSLRGTIINADSMQVYRELGILAASPSDAEIAAVPHRLYGMISAAEAYSVGRWVDDAAAAIADAKSEGRLPIPVGGTGLYFKALLEGLSPVPDIPGETRAFWREQSERLGAEGLHRELGARDPLMAARLHASDPQRVVRALEVIDATGVSLAEWQGREATPVLRSETALKLVIAPERSPLYAKIDARFEAMMAQGALQEVRALRALRLDPGLPAMRAHGVRELAASLEGAVTLEDAVTKAKTESRRYAKRQMTWLKKSMDDWEWVPDADAAVEAALRRVTP